MQLFQAIELDDFSTFQSLLAAAPSPNVKCPIDKWPPLGLAADMNGRGRFIRHLLDKGADVNAQDDFGLTPLFVAIRANNVEAVKLLLDGRADVNQACLGEPPLVCAAVKGVKDVVALLLDAGARTTGMNAKGQTALDAVQSLTTSHTDVEDLLREAMDAAATGTRAGTLQKLSPEEEVLLAVKEKLCTFTSTKAEFVGQKWWSCLTCSPTGEYGLCATCRTTCHKGHKTREEGFAPFYCDCGSQRKVCKALEPPPAPAQPESKDVGADAASLAKYKEALGMALFDGEISVKEEELLQGMRRKFGITAAQHESTLADLNYTLERFMRLHVSGQSQSQTASGEQKTGYENDPDAMQITGKEALIVGNSAYTEKGAALKNPKNDARCVSEALKALGFNVEVALDLAEYDDFKDVVDKFAARLKKHESSKTYGCVGIFMFAGHAIELKGSNYLLHCNFRYSDIGSQGMAAKSALVETLDKHMSSQAIMKIMEENCNTNILILDCCRNNPFLPPAKLKKTGLNSGSGDSDKAKNNGIVAMYPTGSSLVMMSAAPGFTAGDGSSENANNGMFTNSLLKYLPRKDLHVEEVVFQASKDVYVVSGGKQHPWKHSALLKHVYLGAPIVKT